MCPGVGCKGGKGGGETMGGRLHTLQVTGERRAGCDANVVTATRVSGDDGVDNVCGVVAENVDTCTRPSCFRNISGGMQLTQRSRHGHQLKRTGLRSVRWPRTATYANLRFKQE
eukprot:246921-Pleurochrysis_carterae.AAC.3